MVLPQNFRTLNFIKTDAHATYPIFPIDIHFSAIFLYQRRTAFGSCVQAQREYGRHPNGRGCRPLEPLPRYYQLWAYGSGELVHVPPDV